MNIEIIEQISYETVETLNDKEIKTFTCSECGKSFSTRSRCKRHIQSIHTKARPYACQFCNKRFKEKIHCKMHERIHTDERPHACRFCHKKFITGNRLRDHEVNVHQEMQNEKDAPYGCPKCERRFRMPSSLKKHLRIHHNLGHDKSVYTCKVCKKRFRSQHSCTLHELTHVDVDVHLCKFCGMEFTDKGTCERHELTHTNSAILLNTDNARLLQGMIDKSIKIFILHEVESIILPTEHFNPWFRAFILKTSKIYILKYMSLAVLRGMPAKEKGIWFN